MQLKTHILGGAAAGLCLAPDAFSFAACVLGSVAPDVLDVAASCGNKKAWQRIHRTWSHNLGNWGLLLLFLVWLHAEGNPLLGERAHELALFLFLGVGTHLALDFLNPTGVGYCPFRSKARASLHLVTTGGLLDFLIGVSLFAAAAIYRWNAGFDLGRFLGRALGS